MLETGTWTNSSGHGMKPVFRVLMRRAGSRWAHRRFVFDFVTGFGYCLAAAVLRKSDADALSI